MPAGHGRSPLESSRAIDRGDFAFGAGHSCLRLCSLVARRGTNETSPERLMRASGASVADARARVVTSPYGTPMQPRVREAWRWNGCSAQAVTARTAAEVSAMR